MSETPPAPARPSAPVILMRDTTDGIETLLLRRNARLAFPGGAWVFPGGRIDPEDYLALKLKPYATARQALDAIAAQEPEGFAPQHFYEDTL